MTKDSTKQIHTTISLRILRMMVYMVKKKRKKMKKNALDVF